MHFTRTESLFKQRPLTYQIVDIEDIVPLTPNHEDKLGESLLPNQLRQKVIIQGNVGDEFKICSNIFGNNGYRNGSLPYLQNINVTKSKEIERRRHCIDNITRNTMRLSGRALNALPRSLEIVVKADVGGKEFTRPFSKFCSIKFDVD